MVGRCTVSLVCFAGVVRHGTRVTGQKDHARVRRHQSRGGRVTPRIDTGCCCRTCVGRALDRNTFTKDGFGHLLCRYICINRQFCRIYHAEISFDLPKEHNGSDERPEVPPRLGQRLVCAISRPYG